MVDTMYNYDLNGETPAWKQYASEVTSLTFGGNVKDIAAYAFSDMDAIIWINFGGVQAIGRGAFENCSNLRRVITAGGVKSIMTGAFRNCYRVREVNLDGVTNLESKAFENCLSLVSVQIPDAIKSSAAAAFSGCDQIKEIVAPGLSAIKTDANGFLLFEETTVVGYDGRATEVTLPETATAIGDYAFYANTQLTSVTIPNSVKTIGASAFENCTELRTLSVGEGVMVVKANAFANCRSLETLTWNAKKSTASVSASGIFEGAKNLTSLTIGKSVTTIPAAAFRNCTALTSVTLPNTLKVIPERLFSGCTSLASVTLPSSLTEVKEEAFRGCTALSNITFPASLTTIGRGAFRNTAIHTVDLSTVSDIGDGAFRDCTSLFGVIIGEETIISSDSAAFLGCYRLSDVINNGTLRVTKGTTSCGNVARYTPFAIGRSLDEFRLDEVDGFVFMTDPSNTSNVYLIGYTGSETDLTLPANYDGKTYRISENAFRGCVGLESVTIPAGVTEIGNSAFADCLSLQTVNAEYAALTAIGKEAFAGCTALISISLPTLNGFTSIGDAAFYGCSTLASITVPNAVTTLGVSVFQESGLVDLLLGSGVTTIPELLCSGCSDLNTITFRGAVTEIAPYAFTGCSRLENITLPTTLTAIGEYAFYENTRLLRIVLPDSVETVGAHAFENCSRLMSVTVGAGLTDIGTSAFTGCRYLWEVVNHNNTALTLTPGTYTNGGLTINAVSVTTTSAIETVGDYLFYAMEVESGAGTRTMYYLLGYTGYETEITLPANYNGSGYSIAPYAFAYSTVTKVTFSNRILRVGAHAFDSSALESTTLSTSLQAIDGRAFANTPLTEITLNSTVLSSVGDGAFSECKNLRVVTISAGANLALGMNCFAGCSALSEISFPDTLASIGAFCFNRCTALVQCVFPASVTSFGNYWYADCPHLIEVVNLSGASSGNMTSENSNVTSKQTSVKNSLIKEDENGFLIYNKKVIVGYRGTEKNVVLPTIAGGGSIAAYAFYGRTDIETIVINSSITSIGDYAFAGCTSLKAVYLPSSTLIGQDGVGRCLFSGCSDLLAIGTDIASADALPTNWSADWNVISVNLGHEFRITDEKWAEANAGQVYANATYAVNYGISYADFLALIAEA
ncbi:MAG: leucine-rich repeat domain-containing protein, partial [Eubacteriales bacterium]